MLVTIVLLALLGLAQSSRADTLVGGDITSDQLWKVALSPYQVTSTIVIRSGATLTLEAGVVVKFRAGTGLWVGDPVGTNYQGALIVNGLLDQSVLFTAANGQRGGWQGVIFGPGSDSTKNVLTWLVVEKAGETNFRGIKANLDFNVSGTNTRMTNCSSKWGLGYGILLKSANLTMQSGSISLNELDGLKLVESSVFDGENLIISANSGNGVWFSQSSGSLIRSVIDSNDGNGIQLDSASPVVSENMITNNGQSAITYRVSESSPVIHLNQLSGNGLPGIKMVGGEMLTNHTLYSQQGEGNITISDQHLKIFQSKTLNVEAGVNLLFQSGVSLWVADPQNSNAAYRGSLMAKGRQADPIVFTSASGLIGAWPGIIFGPASDDTVSSVMKNCVIEKAGEKNALQQQANISLAYTGGANRILFYDCDILDAALDGLYLKSSDLNMKGCTFDGIGGTGVLSYSSTMIASDTFPPDYQDKPYILAHHLSDPDPVKPQAYFRISLIFNKPMQTSVYPVVTLTSSESQNPSVTSGGTWSTTRFGNDTYTTPPINLTSAMAGLITIGVSAAQDSSSIVMDNAPAVGTFTLDALPPAAPNLTLLDCGAATFTAAWLANSEPDLAGYRLYYWTSLRRTANFVDVGIALEKTIIALSAGNYSVAVSAYDESGLESPDSNILTCTVSGSAYPEAPLALFHLDDGYGDVAIDSSGGGANGNRKGSAEWVNSTINQEFGNWLPTEGALLFDGVDDYVSMGDKIDLGNSDITLEAWVMKTDSSTNSMRLINKGQTDTGTPANQGYMLRFVNGTVEFRVNGDAGEQMLSASEPTPNRWHHLVAVLQQRVGLKIYIDGYPQATLLMSDSIGSMDTDIPFTLGALLDASGNVSERFKGYMDEVYIWNQALTDEMVMRHYWIMSWGLMARYNFDEGSGSVAQDSSYQLNNGSILNGSYVDSDLHEQKSGYDTKTALSFNGSSTYVQIPSSSTLTLYYVSLEAWIKPTASTAGSTRTIMARSGEWLLQLGTSSLGELNHLQAAIAPDGTIFDGGLVPLNTWTHVAIRWDGEDLRMFINGNMTAVHLPVVSTKWLQPTGNPIRIGAKADNSGFFQGQMDNIGIYNRPLGLGEAAHRANYLNMTGWPLGRISTPTTKVTYRVNTAITFDGGKSCDPNFPADYITTKSACDPTYSGSQGNGIKSYFWHFGDGQSLGSLNPQIQHTYTAPGIYHVNLTVYDLSGIPNGLHTYVVVE